jgi:uncharacterized circularly permuted ATP-grasp superfamily protein
MVLSDYDGGGFFDEWFSAPGEARPGLSQLVRMLEGMPDGELTRRQDAAERALLRLGITFNVGGGPERIFPFDVVPRVLTTSEWRRIESGLAQRVQALNLFLSDVYNGRRILRDGVIPEEVVRTARTYRPECEGLRPPGGVWAHVTGTDLVRDRDGTLYVLEDNLRCPSGVSYVLENRQVMKRVFAKAFDALHIRPVDDYPARLRETMEFVRPKACPGSPRMALLTPGAYNSAYFEHAYLAQQMGIDLVEGRDLRVHDGRLHVRTTAGLERVDVLYRRIDDDYLDPAVFRSDSLLGVPGLMDVYRSGRLTIVNAPGTGVADDKVVYAYVPEMIRFYLGEDAILPNVPTYLCWRPKDLAYVLDHLEELVVKAANESGGYGMLVGPQSTAAQRDEFARRVKAAPRNYVAQPTLGLSRVPTLADGKLEGRHVDLRPFVLYGERIWCLPGGLTRVALRKGSLVVNSSQGGGSKDTWIVSVADAPRPESERRAAEVPAC